MKFVSLNTINGASKEHDSVIFVRAEDIRTILAATEVDRRQRKEINSIIITPNGPYGVSQTVAEIVEMCESAI